MKFCYNPPFYVWYTYNKDIDKWYCFIQKVIWG